MTVGPTGRDGTVAQGGVIEPWRVAVVDMAHDELERSPRRAPPACPPIAVDPGAWARRCAKYASQAGVLLAALPGSARSAADICARTASTDAREVSVSFLVGYPKWKVRCSTTAVSSSKDAELDIDPEGLSDRYDRWERRQWHRICSDVGLTWTCKQANNFAPNEYRGGFNSSGLVVYKGSNARDKKY